MSNTDSRKTSTSAEPLAETSAENLRGRPSDRAKGAMQKTPQPPCASCTSDDGTSAVAPRRSEAATGNGAVDAADATAAADYAAQARDFMARSRMYFEDGLLHHASEKGWCAAEHMAKAVAQTQGWRYETHAEFSLILHRASKALGNDRVDLLRGTPNELHSNYCRRKRHLNAEVIGEDLERVVELIDLLEPLATPAAS